MLIMVFLQLTPGVYALFYHYNLGKYSKKKASDLGLFYILGAETTSACLFLCCYYVAFILFLNDYRPETGIFAWIAVGVMIVLATASAIFYYRKGFGSKLFIPRKTAKALDQKASSIKSRSDAFVLGAFSGTYELPFTLPLFIITAVELMEMNAEYYSSNLLTILYIVAPVIPLFIIRWRLHASHNLADIIRMRIKDKTFTRIILSFCYLTIAILIICFRITMS